MTTSLDKKFVYQIDREMAIYTERDKKLSFYRQVIVTDLKRLYER